MFSVHGDSAGRRMALAGKHALVTGGGRGIGAAIAGALAAAGARVTLLGRTTAELEETASALPGDARAVTADVTDAGQVERAFAEARDAGGAISILVNNAGLAKSRPLAKGDEAFWRMMLDVNLTGAWHCTRAVLPAMLAANWGRIVSVSSTAGLRGYAYCTAYCAAKHGLVGFTRALALEVAGRIGVTMLVPGGMRTGFFDDRPEQFRPAPDQRLNDPADVAQTVLFALCQPPGCEVRELIVTPSTEPSWP
jgi:NAD(P)-dependent dehydrogenase (short-subunit alcohol dehydrogenase family)